MINEQLPLLFKNHFGTILFRFFLLDVLQLQWFASLSLFHLHHMGLCISPKDDAESSYRQLQKFTMFKLPFSDGRRNKQEMGKSIQHGCCHRWIMCLVLCFVIALGCAGRCGSGIICWTSNAQQKHRSCADRKKAKWDHLHPLVPAWTWSTTVKSRNKMISICLQARQVMMT